MTLDLSKLSILVVDDVKAMRMIVLRVLKTLGVGTLYEAEDGDKAYQLYCQKMPDMIISDWHMTPVSGIELVRKIRRSAAEFNPSVPIIMMTGFNDLSRISEARDNGITEFIVKPFSAEDIAKRITHSIKNPRDFIRGKEYVGPDRRRRANDVQAKKKRRQDDKHRIPANTDLQCKIGIGVLNPKIIERSQDVIDNNEIDFRPLASSLLQQLDEAIKDYKSGTRPLDKVGNEIIDIVMQIKGNAGIFHYELMGNLANIMLQFLENLNSVDQDAVDIVIACHQTLRLIAAKQMRGEGGELGIALSTELKAACERYHKSRKAS